MTSRAIKAGEVEWSVALSRKALQMAAASRITPVFTPGLFYSSCGGYDEQLCRGAGFNSQLCFRSILGLFSPARGTSGAMSEWATITSGST